MFSGLWVHPHPTEEHRAYLVLSLDVSRVAADAGPELLRPTFLEAVRGRVAAFLLEMADRLASDEAHEDGAPLRFALPFGRQEIADLLGLTIETVSRQITRLREDAVIDTPDRRSIVVLDRDALEACAGNG